MRAVQERLSAALAERYRIERELGAGGMATVCLAQDLKHDRKVAIKVLRPELAAVIVSLFKPGSPRQNLTLLQARPLDTGGVILRYVAKPRDG
jgi:serine/threonine protein kinase